VTLADWLLVSELGLARRSAAITGRNVCELLAEASKGNHPAHCPGQGARKCEAAGWHYGNRHQRARAQRTGAWVASCRAASNHPLDASPSRLNRALEKARPSPVVLGPAKRLACCASMHFPLHSLCIGSDLLSDSAVHRRKLAVLLFVAATLNKLTGESH